MLRPTNQINTRTVYGSNPRRGGRVAANYADFPGIGVIPGSL
jgi:hypothetical protein